MVNSLVLKTSKSNHQSTDLVPDSSIMASTIIDMFILFWQLPNSGTKNNNHSQRWHLVATCIILASSVLSTESHHQHLVILFFIVGQLGCDSVDQNVAANMLHVVTSWYCWLLLLVLAPELGKGQNHIKNRWCWPQNCFCCHHNDVCCQSCSLLTIVTVVTSREFANYTK